MAPIHCGFRLRDQWFSFLAGLFSAFLFFNTTRIFVFLSRTFSLVQPLICNPAVQLCSYRSQVSCAHIYIILDSFTEPSVPLPPVSCPVPKPVRHTQHRSRGSGEPCEGQLRQRARSLPLQRRWLQTQGETDLHRQR